MDLAYYIFIIYNMSAEVFSESLAYPKMKQRAVSSRSFRTKISPSNSQSFSPGQTINVDLPGNLSGQYYNFSQMYLKVRLTTATHPAELDRAGIVSAIKRVQISQAGSQIYDLNNYNVLYTALLDTESNAEWRGSVGNIMTGTKGNSLGGETVPAGSRTYCIPLVLNPLANTTPHRLIPAFSMSSIQFKITLDEQASFLKYASANAPTGVVFDEVEMVCLMTELSPQAQAMIDAQTGGVYNILANSYMNSTANVASTISNASVNLGFSVSSLERILMVQRTSADLADNEKFSIGNRIRNDLTEYSYQINSESYPQRPILVDDKSAEACAELLVAEHSLVDFRKGNNLNGGVVQATNIGQLSSFVGGDPSKHPSDYGQAVGSVPAGTTAGSTAGAVGTPTDAVPSTIGTAVYGCEFETGLSDGKSSHIYSGVSTLASNVQALLKYDSAHVASQLDFFAQFSVLLSLDMRGSGVFSVSV